MADEIKVLAEQMAADVATAPDVVQLFKLGEMTARDGRQFVLTDPDAVIAKSRRSGGLDLVIDYEHQKDGRT